MTTEFDQLNAIAARVAELRDLGVDRFHVLYLFVQSDLEGHGPYIAFVQISAEPIDSPFVINQNWFFDATEGDDWEIACKIHNKGEEFTDGWDWEDEIDDIEDLPHSYDSNGQPLDHLMRPL